MDTVRVHPIVRFGALLVACRLVGVIVRYGIQTPGSIGDRLALLLPAVLSHTGALTIVVSLFLLASIWLRAFRRPIALTAVAVFGFLIIFGQADFIVSAITGAPLTPTVFRTFRGIRVVTSNEFLEPLRSNLAVTGGGFAVFAGVLAWMTRVAGRAVGSADGAEVRPSRAVAGLVAGALLLVLPSLAPWPVPPLPVEAAFAREYLGLDRVVLAEPEADAIRNLRSMVGLPQGAAWLSDEYPLVYGWPQGSARLPADPPDIVVVMVESLRAEELAFVTGAGESVTPNVDAFARRSVVFPTYTSNGFPSAPSVLSFQASAWPHRRKEIITDFVTRGFDSIPSRLRGLGYDTVYVGADPHFDNQALWMPRWYATAVDLVAGGIVPSDRNIVSRGVDEIRRHDAATPGQPLFEFISTYSTHYPFRLPEDAGEAAVPASAGLAAQYRQTLRYTDRQLGSLLEFLAARPRRDRTVTIIVGDHSFYTDLRKTSGLPENDNIWTVAMIAGPEAMVGSPRRIEGPSSHVDMLPTILAMVGDRRPSAALGRDLLGGLRTDDRAAFAVRPGGLRFDRSGYAVVVDARVPNRADIRVAFPGLIAPGSRPDEITAARLTDWVTTWSFLIERNRVWNDTWLMPSGVSRAR
jgi:hypothetical protein